MTINVDQIVEKREKIIELAKRYNMKELWVIRPKGGTLLEASTLYIVYNCEEGKSCSLRGKMNFLEALKEDLGVSLEVSLNNLSAMEQAIVVSPWEKSLICTQLQNLVPFENLQSGLALIDHSAVAKEPASQATVREEMQKTLERYNKEHPVTSKELALAFPAKQSYKRMQPLEGEPLATEHSNSAKRPQFVVI